MGIESLIMSRGRFSPGKAFTWVVFFIFVVVVIANLSRLIERNSSGIYQVNQSYWDGEITTRFEPGVYAQKLAEITPYKAATSYHFTDKKDAKNVTADPIIVRFNDGGRAKVHGDVRFVLPRNNEDMKRIKLIFDDDKTLTQELYSQIVKEAMVMTAALMSSEESYHSLRPQFSEWGRDQVLNGIYIVEKEPEVIENGNDGEAVIRDIAKIKMIKDENGVLIPARKEKVLSKYGIGLQQFVIEDIEYLDGLDEMIGKKNEYLNKIIEVKSRGQMAEQQNNTAEADGKKRVEEARYKMLREKEKIVSDLEKQKEVQVIEAKRELDVAIQDEHAALNNKEKLKAEGQGQAEKRALALKADGALGMKKDYYVQAWKFYFDALKEAQLVPSVASAGYYNNNGSGMPQGVALLYEIENMLRSELGLDLTFDDGKQQR